MALLAGLLIGLVGLILVPGWSFYFDVVPKVAVLLMGTACMLLSGRFEPKRLPRILRLLLLPWVLWLVVSALFSADMMRSIGGTNWRRFGMITQFAIILFTAMVASHTAGRPDRARTLLRGVALAGLLAGAYGIAQYFGWDPFLPAAAYHVGQGVGAIVRPPGTLGYASYFATWLVFVACLAMALAGMETSARWRALAYSVAGVAAVATVLTGTRAALLGLAAASGVAAYGRVRLNRKVVAGVVVAVVAGAAFYWSPAGLQMRHRTRWFVEDPWGGARLLLWRDSLRMGLARPLAGYGPEVFTAQFPAFESKELARAYPDYAHESPHNIFLDALVSQGIPGVLILAGLCVAGFMARGKGTRWITAALAGGVVCQWFTAFTAPTALIFFTTVALALGLAADDLPQRRPSVGLTIDWVPLIVLFLMLMSNGIPLIVADHALAQARRALDTGDLISAAADFQKYQRWSRRSGNSSDLWYSRALLALAGRTTDPAVRTSALATATVAGSKATKTAEDPFNAWYNLAEIYAARNDADMTETCLRQAITARPNWFKPHWTMARLLVTESRWKEAEREAVLAVDLDGGKNIEVTATLQGIRERR